MAEDRNLENDEQGRAEDDDVIGTSDEEFDEAEDLDEEEEPDEEK